PLGGGRARVPRRLAPRQRAPPRLGRLARRRATRARDPAPVVRVRPVPAAMDDRVGGCRGDRVLPHRLRQPSGPRWSPRFGRPFRPVPGTGCVRPGGTVPDKRGAVRGRVVAMLVALTVAGTAATAATACHTASRAPAHPAPPSGTLTTPDARALVEDYEGRLAAAYAAGDASRL